MKKLLTTFCLLLTVVLTSSYFTNAADDKISVYVNNNEMVSDAEPFIQSETTMVPMRDIFEALDADVNWESETKTITAQKDDIEVKLQIDNLTLSKNGVDESLSVAPTIVDGTTYVPIRAISQSFGVNVQWLPQNKGVYIDSDEKYNEDYEKVETESMSINKVTIYALDGRTAEVLESEVEDYKNVGWYTEPVVKMYAPDGRTIVVEQSKIEEYEGVGWYTEPVTKMYSADGRTIYVKNSQVESQKQVGWYLTPPKKAVSNTTTSSSSYSNYTSSSQNIGNTVYITPTGKRYHYSSSCAGKNARATTLSKAQQSGYTPCKKCA